MARLTVLPTLVLALLALVVVDNAGAVDCAPKLNGVINGAGECEVSGTVTVNGTVNLDETLRLTGTARLNVPSISGVVGNTLTINACTGSVLSCDIIMEDGARIIGDTAGTGARVGATISLNATNDILMEGSGASGALISSRQLTGGCVSSRGGNVNLSAGFEITMQPGSLITVDAKCPAGAVTIISAQGSVDLDGKISSVSAMTGTGGSQRPAGGPITVIARCDLSVDGELRSQGIDPGADLIHLEGGCQVAITGLVVSTGAGHGTPSNPPNHCNSVIRPDKPANSTACIEVWAGDGLTITNTAELIADTGGPGGNAGTGWIDLFSRGPILVTGRAAGAFSVHANGVGGSGGDGEEGGIVTVKSTTSTVTATDRAFQAAALTAASNADGGSITAQGAGAVALDTAVLDASGGIAGVGDTGGSISVRSFQGALSWQNGAGDVRPNATGTIALEACGAITTAGTNWNGAVPTLTPASCAVAAPTLPDYVVLPECLCGTIPGDGVCPEDRDHLITRVVDPSGTPHGVLKVHATLSAAVTEATSGETIGVFGITSENASVASKRLTITQCTVAKIVALDGGEAAVKISSPEKIIVIGLDTQGGTVGWQVDSSNHELRGVRVVGASEFGILVTGNGNRVSWNSVRQSAVGVGVTGNGNDLRGGVVELNSGDGVRIGGTGNILRGATVQDNGGNGIAVPGTGNTIRDNPRVDANGKSGVRVAGTGNIIKGNTAGSSDGRGNILDGFRVVAGGNTLDSNKASDNGQDGFDIASGTDVVPNVLKGNQSNVGSAGGSRENADAEFRLAGTIQNKGGNKADGINVPKFFFPSKCTSFPTGTTTLPAPVTCE